MPVWAWVTLGAVGGALLVGGLVVLGFIEYIKDQLKNWGQS